MVSQRSCATRGSGRSRVECHFQSDKNIWLYLISGSLAWFALLSVGDPDSPIELVDQAPAEIKLTRLDIDSADQLAGWQILPPEFQN